MLEFIGAIVIAVAILTCWEIILGFGMFLVGIGVVVVAAYMIIFMLIGEHSDPLSAVMVVLSFAGYVGFCHWLEYREKAERKSEK